MVCPWMTWTKWVTHDSEQKVPATSTSDPHTGQMGCPSSPRVLILTLGVQVVCQVGRLVIVECVPLPEQAWQAPQFHLSVHDVTS